MQSSTTTELDLSIREDQAGHDLIVCHLQNGTQVHMKPHEARIVATRLIHLVSQAEIRSMLSRKDRFARTSDRSIPDALPMGRYITSGSIEAE